MGAKIFIQVEGPAVRDQRQPALRFCGAAFCFLIPRCPPPGRPRPVAHNVWVISHLSCCIF